MQQHCLVCGRALKTFRQLQAIVKYAEAAARLEIVANLTGKQVLDGKGRQHEKLCRSPSMERDFAIDKQRAVANATRGYQVCDNV